MNFQRNTTIHTVVGKYHLSGAMMLLMGRQTEVGLFHISKGTVFMKQAFVLNSQTGPLCDSHCVIFLVFFVFN